MNAIAVAIGGFLGALARFFMGTWMAPLADQTGFPWGTLTINLLGAFVLAFFLTVAMEVVAIKPALRLGFATGFLGAFTTFSTFALESVRMLEAGEAALAGAYVLSSLVLGVLVSALGTRGARMMKENRPAALEVDR
ncbi:fluoride efflux transporter CrcB [Heliobacterium gestii]|uniref:Fluoride-specific ion channel FluC n=1 Tax=Heliomicrobium gestii TaxID=2699 RepID=A0A845LHL8_HELGE|nr:fluoride efflux transporter CrcB [Heliomicrobium gestii]MBM7867537.1 CrcB protein [Heliomicrobium gestii]MZP43915.1 fluoride efflux transporter CrcB [Heliomicrobium gestii]